MYFSRKLACVLECRHAILIILHSNTVQNTIKYAKPFHILKFSLCFKLKLAFFFFFSFMFSKELEDLRKQGEIIPQLMSECESVSEQLQVQFSNEINLKIVDTFTFFLVTICFPLFRLQHLKAREVQSVKTKNANYVQNTLCPSQRKSN